MLRPLLLVLALQAAAGPLPAMLERARQHLEAADRPAARRELTEALRLYPSSPAVHNFLGVLEAGEGNFREAEKRFREAVARAPDYTDAWLNLGRLYQENAGKDPEAATKAVGAYQAILRYEPRHAEARFQSAALLQAKGEFGRSLEELGRLPPAAQERPAAVAVRLADHVGKGERAEADAAAGKLLSQGGFDALDVRPVLPVLSAHGRADLAIRLLEDLRRRGGAVADDLQGLGLLYEKDGRLAEARVRLEEAARDRPDSVPLLLDLARVAHKARDGKGALGYLAHARALEPGNARVHLLFGMECVELDLGAEAYSSLREAVRLAPENAAVNYAMGAVALHRKDPTEAIPYFRKYAELEPGEPRGPFAVGVAAFQAKDYETARRLLVPAAARPETAAGASYFLARIARAEGEFEEGLRFALRSVEVNPTYADPWSELGLLYLRLGQPEKAAEALERCLKLDPEHYLGNLHLMMLYSQTRDSREPAQRRRFEEIRTRRDEKGTDFLRPIEVRPY
ncbi:MAG TPA: tetratricopeptide repeat protein [Vicinamibacteria bacterium]|nr:tetratricopeptide repeat protein [Vicinamibacteria bacterium]